VATRSFNAGKIDETGSDQTRWMSCTIQWPTDPRCGQPSAAAVNQASPALAERIAAAVSQELEGEGR
jgi:hypothetical protein